MRSILEQKALWYFAGGPATAAELARELDISPSTAGVLTWKLCKEGDLQVQTVRHRGVGGGPGRGVNVYSIPELKRAADGMKTA